MRFTQPLVHAAVYDELGPLRRAQLHSRAADLDTNDDTRLHHRVRAASGPDIDLSGDLAELGRRQAAVGAWSAAAHHLSAAARLTPDGADFEQLTMEAVECQILGGDLARAVGVAPRIRAFSPTAWRSFVLAHLAFMSGKLEESETLLMDAWRRCQPQEDPLLAARIAGQLAGVHVFQGRGAEVARWSGYALELAPEQTTIELLHYLPLVGSGLRGEADEALASLTDLPAPAEASMSELEVLLGRGLLRLWTDDLQGAHRDVTAVLAHEGERSVASRVGAIALLGQAEYRLGHWDDATVHHDLGISIAEDAGAPWLAPLLHATAVLVHAGRGDWLRADAHLAAAESGAQSSGGLSAVVYGGEAAAHLAAARGDPEGVVSGVGRLRAIRDADGAYEPGIVAWQDLLVEALVALGDHEEALATLEPFEAKAAERGRRSALAAAARARGTLCAALGDSDGATTSFEAGLEHIAHVEMPFDRARIELAYGSFLRRGGSRRAAATHLEAGRAILERLGARPYLERCHRELAACGLAPAGRGDPDFTRLTPQELAVARLARRGLTNRQIARELIVSIKTVEYHLGHVYTKLNVKSRAELAHHLVD
jgi:DNA-binding CsgD family transcriptional regulator